MVTVYTCVKKRKHSQIKQILDKSNLIKMFQAFQSLYAMLRVIMGATDIPNMHDEKTQAKTWWQWIIDSIVWYVLWSPSVTFTLGVICALIVMATVRLIISIFKRDREGSTIINNTFEVKIFYKGMDVCEWLMVKRA